VAEVMNNHWINERKKCILIDDMIDTAGTVTLAGSSLGKEAELTGSLCLLHHIQFYLVLRLKRIQKFGY